MSECRHGLDERWCAVCIHGVSEPPEGPVTVGPAFRARYEGQCYGCALPIAVGQDVRAVELPGVTDGRLVYVHTGCEP